MKQIEVSIMGQSYLLGCPEGGEERLKEAVSRVDREMCAIRDSGKLRARERIAVLSALNLAFDLASLPPSPAPAGPQSSTQEAGTNAALDHTIDQLIHRLDATLNDDGHLL
jgi:cell division protein ZapA